MENIAEQLDELDIHDHDPPRAALQVVTDLLNRLRDERQHHAKEQQDSNRHAALLKASVAKLASQNMVLHARLLATLDSLDVAQHKLDSSDVAEENKALLLVNDNLGQRLRDANAERNRLAEALSASHEISRDGNRSYRSSISLTRQTYRHDQPPHQDMDDDTGSDTTEVQGHAHASQTKARSQRLRTRTVLLELIEEVESGRKRLKQSEIDREEAVSLLQAHLETRDREIASLHQQLSDISTLPALVNMTSTDVEGGSAGPPPLADTQSLLQDLNEQVRKLKSDLEYLRNERDSVRTYAMPASATSGRSRNGSDVQPHSDEHVEIGRLHDQIASQRREFDTLAVRARDKLEEQQISLNASREEVKDLHKALHQVEQLASEANEVLSEEKAKRERAERILASLQAPTASEQGSPRSTPIMTRRYSMPAFTEGHG